MQQRWRGSQTVFTQSSPFQAAAAARDVFGLELALSWNTAFRDPSWPLPVVVMATADSSAIAVDRSFAAVA
jgi:hypothetical protein